MGKSPFNFYLKRLLYIVLFAILVMMFMDLNDRLSNLFHKDVQRDALREEVYELRLTSYVLETQMAYATSELSVEEWARVQGKLMRPSDIPIIPLPAQSWQPTPTPKQVQQATRVANWDVWKALFWGD